ncbi:hypothetical protein MPER_15022, partial [Moniliophthora perniciosa FA553]
GRTAHLMFKIPIHDLNEESYCQIAKHSARAELLKQTRLIVWDEVGAQHQFAVEALDRTLRDICDDNRTFGGITTVLGGDFQQTLPVITQGTRDQIL